MSTALLYRTDAPGVNYSAGPSTREDQRRIGSNTVSLYRVWAGGYNVTTRAGNVVTVQRHSRTKEGAERIVAAEVKRLDAELETLAATMLALDECRCVVDSQSCPACRRTACRVYADF